jgi:Icc-related predicted phosphoesterase
MRVAAVGDLHCQTTSYGSLYQVFHKIAEQADALLLAGDLTSTGQPQELAVLLEELEGITLPIVAVLGNHEYDSGKVQQLLGMMQARGIIVLGEEKVAHAINGQLGVVGVKGFGGGFSGAALTAFGEPAIKSFVREAMDEALKIESGLTQLDTEHKIVLLHYAPIRGTVVGENPEIYPYLGSSRLEDSIDRAGATLVFHGHAHRGTPEGRTRGGTPVFNVAWPMLRKMGVDYLLREL